MEWLDLFINDPRALSIGKVIVYAAGGIIGALVKLVQSEKGVLVLPYRTKRELHLGFLATVLIGMTAAILADGNFLTALLSGYAGSHLLDRFARPPGRDPTPEPTPTPRP